MKSSGSFRCLFLAAVLFPSVLLAAAKKFDIPAQPAGAALQLFGKQSGADVAYPAPALKEIQSTAVQGEFEPSAALEQLLTGTGYTASQTGAARFVVTKIEAAKPGSIEGEVRVEKGGRPAVGVKVALDGSDQATITDKRGRFHFDDVPAGAYALLITADGIQNTRVTDVTVANGHRLSLSAIEVPTKAEGTLALDTYTVSAKKNDGVIELDPYAVTGVKEQPFAGRNVDLPRTINDVQPYVIFDSQKIEESGASSVEDFLRQQLTTDTTVQTTGQVTKYSQQTAPGGPNSFSGIANTGTSSINLNGLGADHTLILVNGMRMVGVSSFTGNIASTVTGQPDVNGIPLAAIDHIEVLSSSAGAIYGASVEGGVINIILKKSYSGGELRASYGSTWDGYGPTRSIEATFGKSFEGGKTQVFVTAQYSDQSPMYVRDRAALEARGLNAYLTNAMNSAGGTLAGLAAAGPPLVGATPNIVSFGYYSAGDPSQFNNPAYMLTLKSTGASLNSVIATLPTGYSANSSPSSIIGGQWNLNPGDGDVRGTGGLSVPLGDASRRKALMATVTRQMTPNLQLHADFSTTENHSYSTFDALPGTTGVVITASAPINPFNQDVVISYPTNRQLPVVSDSNIKVVSLGGTLQLPFDWVSHLEYQWSESKLTTTDDSYNYIDPYQSAFRGDTFFNASHSNTFLGAPDNNPTPLWSGAINPFVDTLAHPINFDPFLIKSYTSSRNTSNDLVLAAAGPLMHWSWGDPRLSVRLEHLKNETLPGAISDFSPLTTLYTGLPIGTTWHTLTSFGQGQSTDSAAAEFDIPVFKSQRPLLHSLDLQLNVRRETTNAQVGTPGINTFAPYTYSTYPNGSTFLLFPNTLGNTATPLAAYTNQAGSQVPASTAQPFSKKASYSRTDVTGPALSYRPTEDILLRASIASGFVPPTYQQLLPTNFLQTTTRTNVTDPTTHTTYQVNSVSLGGNPDLKPATSKSWNLGAVWEPKQGSLKGLRLDAEFTKTEQYNVIQNLAPQTIVNLESQFPGLVVRDSTGLITTVYRKFINAAEARQEAWTFTGDYTKGTSIGSFEFTAAVSVQKTNAQQLLAGTNFVEFVGFPNSGGVAKTKGIATLRWSNHGWVAAWTTTYLSSYKQVGAAGDPYFYGAQLELGQPYDLDPTYTSVQGGDTIPSQVYHNIYLSRTFRKGLVRSSSAFGRFCDSFLDGLRVSLVVNNVFNKVPPFDAYYAPFYTSPFGDVRLRSYELTLRKSF